MKLLLATRNAHKTREISQLLKNSAIEVAGLDAFPDLPEVVEDQPTIEGNARKKAAETAQKSGFWSLADDTGLEVEALAGAPGVFSARYAGPGCDFAANNRKLLAALKGVPEARRKASFRTVMALSDPAGKTVIAEGRLDGAIAEAPAGSGGFGYDPIFFVPERAKTLAEMTLEEKNGLSHRARALRAILPRLLELAACAACVLAFAAAPARAARTEPGQETIWDEIMADQANRGLRVGSRLMEEKRYDVAEKEFERAVLANPRDANAHMMLGAAHYWTGKIDLAMRDYARSLELDPKNAQAVMLMGIALAWKGDNKGAYEAFKKAAELDPTRADIQMNLGSIEEALGLMPEALAHFRKAVSIDPRHPLYHFQLGMLYRRMGRDADAVDSMREALKIMPTFEDALIELGAADERRGDKKAAIHSFKKAVGLKARDSVARFRLGRLLLANGERARAREVMFEAFHLTPEGEGSGLQLSVSYAGGKRNAPPDGEPGKPPPPPPADSKDPLDVFARNLERIPAEQGAVMQVDVAFVPRPKLVKANSGEIPSALTKALAQAAGAPGPASAPKIVRKEFPLPAASPEQRSRQIKKVINDLRAAMEGAPAGADVRFGMNLTYTRLADAAPGRAPSQGAPKVSYQPRQVGNDLDLWVIGTGWMALVEEVLPEAGGAAPPEDSDWWVATGLGYAAIGDGQRAMAAFERACAISPHNELALLGRGVGAVMTGNDAGAIVALQEVLRLNPNNRAAREGLNWLLRPSGAKKI